MPRERITPRSRGRGTFRRTLLRACGTQVVVEPGALVLNPAQVSLGSRIYIGHYAILDGWVRGDLRIGDGCWIGPGCYLHAAGGIAIGEDVGIAPQVRIITSQHRDEGRTVPVLLSAVEFGRVEIGAGSDLGVGATILPGVRIGRGCIIGAGAVVTRDVPDFAVAAGVPAKVLRRR